MEEETVDGVKISEFPTAQSVTGNDLVTGLKVESGVKTNANFTVSSLLSAIINAVRSAFVPANRKVNGKTLDSDISLTASDVGAVGVGEVGAADGVASLDSTGKVPGTQLDLSGKQSIITANGILKGDGQGGISAATAGTDYQAPLTAGTDYATPGMIPTVPSAYTSNPAMDGTASPGSSGAWAKGDHVHPSDTSKANQDQLAYVETGATASRAYAVGEYFCWNGLLYRATTAISSGQSFNPGTNCEQATEGGFNNIIRWLTHSLVTQSSYTINSLHLELLSSRLMVVSFSVTCVTASSSSVNIGGIPSGYRPGDDMTIAVPSLSGNALNFRARQNGYVNAWGGTAGQTYNGTLTYVIP